MAKIAFIQNFWSEYIGLMSISSVLKSNGHETKAFLGHKRKIVKQVLDFCPDVVGFTCFTGSHRWILDISQTLKSILPKNSLQILGGPHPTFFPKDMIDKPGVDVICLGESDFVVLECIKKYLQNNIEGLIKIPGLWVKINGTVYKNKLAGIVDDLDALPFPDRELYRDNKFIINNPTKTVMAGRGCPFHCTFCFSKAQRNLYGRDSRFVRLRSVENMIEELKTIKCNYFVERFEFADDTFALNKGWLFNFLKEYKKSINLPFLCNTRADITDEETVKELKSTGCYRVSFGVETANEEYRNTVLKKNITSEHIMGLAKLLHKYNLDFETTNMVGLPGETLQSAINTLKFNRQIKSPSVWCAIWQPFPGTDLADYAIRHNYIRKINLDSAKENVHTSSTLRQKDIDKIVLFHKFFYIFYRFPKILRFKKLLLKGRYCQFHDYFYRACFLWFYYIRKYRLRLGRLIKEIYIALRYY